MLTAEREQLPGIRGVGQAGERTGFCSRVTTRSPPAPTCCQVAGSPGKDLTSTKRQRTTFHAGGGVLLELWAVCA